MTSISSAIPAYTPPTEPDPDPGVSDAPTDTDPMSPSDLMASCDSAIESVDTQISNLEDQVSTNSSPTMMLQLEQAISQQQQYVSLYSNMMASENQSLMTVIGNMRPE